MLKLENLVVVVGGKKVLNGFTLSIEEGEIHAIMGPNGSGKSSLSKVIAGHPDYEVTHGRILFESNFQQLDITDMPPDERARLGIFLGFQYPVEIPGVKNWQFLKMAFDNICRAQGVAALPEEAFQQHIERLAARINMPLDFLKRDANAGFSGGEKKRNEILQMLLLNPRMAILDEIDSGLDVDALRDIAQGVNGFRSGSKALLLITHYERLLKLITPTVVHVMMEGRIVQTGNYDLINRVESGGYEAFEVRS